jgi:voltage-gated potassium channel
MNECRGGSGGEIPDQLHEERGALKQELFDRLADGKLSEDEIEVINREARRLHLSAADVEVLIDEARPEHALEHYKTLVSEIRQLGLLTDARQFESAAG